MADIEISRAVPLPVETICGPVSDFKDLTLSSNAVLMGHYGTIAGIIISVTTYAAYYYVAPRLIVYGKIRGWWS
jgi:hypothetical protein